MKNFISIFLMASLVLSVSCNNPEEIPEDGDTSTNTPVEGGNGSTPTDPGPTNPGTTNPPTSESNLPVQALTFSTNVTKVSFTDAQAQKYDKAIRLVKLVVGTEEFRTRVLNYTYNGSKTFADNGGKTNAQIYQSILDAAETLQPAKNNRMDLEVELYYASNSTVGYTYPNSKRIWVNTKFFNSYIENSVAANLFHEWLHKLGYTHDSAATAKRPYTVPYAIGSIMRDIASDFL